MRKFSKGEDEAEVNMTPLLDIVFIMLIFFIVTASFVKEQGLEITKPPNDQTTDQEPDPDKAPIAFVIDDGNRIRHDFRVIDISAVSSIIKRVSVERPEVPVVIQTSEGSHMGLVIRIFDEAKLVGFTDDRIIVVPKKK